MDVFLLGPSLKKTDYSAVVGAVDHLLSHAIAAGLSNGRAQTRCLMDTLQAGDGRYAQAVLP